MMSQAQTPTYPVTITVNPPTAGVIDGFNCNSKTPALAAGTPIGPCKFTPNPGWIFINWSASGSVYCNASTATTCGPYSLAAPGATLTANAVQPSTGNTPPPPSCTEQFGHPCVAISCTPSTMSTAATPGTTNILRATSATGPFVSVSPTAPPSCTFQDINVVYGQTYYYEVTATVGSTTTAPTAPISITMPPQPVVSVPPTRVNATVVD